VTNLIFTRLQDGKVRIKNPLAVCCSLRCMGCTNGQSVAQAALIGRRAWEPTERGMKATPGNGMQ
jgi:hypothetical protein